jgi:hypothetical protein
MLSFGGCFPVGSKVTPRQTLIQLIKGFETDETLLKFIQKAPKSLSEADEVCFLRPGFVLSLA